MYAAVEDLKKRIGDLYADLYIAPDGSAMDTDAADDLDAAAAEINGRICKRYQVPVTSPGALPLLKSWTVTLAEELAWARSGKPDTPENVKRRVDNIRKQLDAVAEGSMSLDAAEAVNTTTAGLVLQCDEPLFTKKKLRRFR